MKVFEGFLPGSSIGVGVATTSANTFYGVEDGATVDIDIATDFGFSASPTPPDRPELRIAVAR